MNNVTPTEGPLPVRSNFWLRARLRLPRYSGPGSRRHLRGPTTRGKTGLTAAVLWAAALLFAGRCAAFAQESPGARTTAVPAVSAPRRLALPTATGRAPQLRRLPPARLRALRRQSDFQYEIPAPERQSAWDLFWWRVRQWLSELLAGRGYQERGRYVVYGLFALAFLYLLLRVLRLDLTGMLGRAARPVPLSYDDVPEDIHGLDFPALLTDAEAAGNFRLAVRLGYLQALHALSEHQLIQWQPDKTNQHYLTELAGTSWQPPFARLTHQFEYAWYGEQPLTPATYGQVRLARQAFLDSFTRRVA